MLDIVEPTPEGYDWSGLYLGLHAGYAWGNSEVESDVDFAGATHDHDIDGFVGGVHGGFNFQTDSLVFGLEGDFDYADIDGDSDCSNPSFTCSTDLEWLASVRARLGFAFDSVLLYATGGAAFAEIEFANKGASAAEESGTEVGFVVGGGAEHAISEDFSVRVEGLYYDFTSLDGFNYDNDGPVPYDGSVDFIVIRGGISWNL